MAGGPGGSLLSRLRQLAAGLFLVAKAAGAWPYIFGLLSPLAVWWLDLLGGLPSGARVILFLCVGVAVFYAALVPTVLDVIARNFVYQRPRYDVWRGIERLSVKNAASLMADVDPYMQSGARPSIVFAWETRLVQAMEDGKLEYTKVQSISDYDNRRSVEPPSTSTIVTRGALKEYADKENIRPRFLR